MAIKLWWSVLLTLGVATCYANNNIPIGENSVDVTVAQNSMYEVSVEDMLPFLARDLTLLSQAIDTLQDGACRKQSELLLANLPNLTTWAVKFYDASGKFPEGVLGGSTYQIGNYDECLDIGSEPGDEIPPDISPQYCMVDIDIRVPDAYLDMRNSIWEEFRPARKRYEEYINEVHWGVCLPAACKARDIEGALTRILSEAFNGSKLHLSPRVSEKNCYKKEPLVVNTTDIIYVCFVLTIASIVITGTIFHMTYLWKGDIPKSTLAEVLVAFSLISNWKKLCGPAHQDGLKLECISGIKVVSMGLIIGGHCLIYVVSGPVVNASFWKHAIYKVENAVFLNNPLLVDTFLFLSGFLFCRILLRELDKRKSINFLLLYFYRYLRLTPAYMVVVGLYVTWLPKLNSGPFWSRMQVEKERCLVSWWANILYINNYVNTNHLCMFQSWYLSVDTQLFILAPAVIYPLWRWRRSGELILAGVTALSILIPFSVTLFENLDPTLMIYLSEVKDITTNEYFKNTYIKTHMRASAYCFGLIYGYIVYRMQTENIKLSKKVVRLSWLFCTLSVIIAMFSISIFYGLRREFTTIESAIYSAMHRAMWSIGIGWILLACITDNSGPLRNILKWRLFVPLSRLTYTAYLVNGFIEIHSASTLRTAEYLNTYTLFSKVMSHIQLTFGAAVILSMMFESPILGLEKIFLRNERKSSESIRKTDSAETTTTDA